MSRRRAVVPTLQRYELKFVVPADMIAPISEFASVYCSPDKYSAKSEDMYYRVNNLYFDTPDYLFLRRRLNGCDKRFNMRIRTYSDTNPLPCFFEIKQKNVNIIKKYRARMTDEAWPRLLASPEYMAEKDGLSPEDANRNLFIRTAYTYNIEPKVLSQYRRKAYVSDVDDYARVTFDIDLRSQPPDGHCLLPDECNMVPLDHELLFDPGCSVVLELKCYTSRVPLWMIDLIRCFDLHRRSFSKYVNGVRNVMGRYSYDRNDRGGKILSRPIRTV